MTPPIQEPDEVAGGGRLFADAEEDVALLWREVADGSPDARNSLILHYSPLVKFVAGRVGSSLPPSVEQADLVSYGMLGLIDAIEKYDLDRGIKFETYAMSRIRGAILDELRALDWVPRSVRSKARQIQKSIARLENTLRRAPTDEELAADLEISVDELQNQLGQISQVSVLMLEDMLTVGGEDDQVSLIDTIEATDTPEPGESLERHETEDALRTAIESLPERERLVITLYYFERLTLAQIGEVLGVTESRVSQIHTKCVLQLRSRMSSDFFD